MKPALKNLVLKNLFSRTKTKKEDLASISAVNILKHGLTAQLHTQDL
jgi:hypothetical protein